MNGPVISMKLWWITEEDTAIFLLHCTQVLSYINMQHGQWNNPDSVPKWNICCMPFLISWQPETQSWFCTKLKCLLYALPYPLAATEIQSWFCTKMKYLLYALPYLLAATETQSWFCIRPKCLLYALSYLFHSHSETLLTPYQAELLGVRSLLSPSSHPQGTPDPAGGKHLPSIVLCI